MRIVIGSDHRGYMVKGNLIGRLTAIGHQVHDVGPRSSQSVDYPDYGSQVALQVASGQAERGILLCGSGIGMCIVANKVPGVRAATCHDEVTAELSRRHNDVNVLCMSADLLGEQMIYRIVDVWLKTEFEAGRHARRVNKITTLEAGPER